MANTPVILTAQSFILSLYAFVDGYSTHQHTLTTSISDTPIESGALITDHAVPKPAELRLTGHTTDIYGGDRPAEAWLRIKALRDSVTPFRVITEWATYPSMLIAQAVGDPEGRGGRWELQLREVEIVTPGVAPPPVIPGNPLEFFRDPANRGGGISPPPRRPPIGHLARARLLAPARAGVPVADRTLLAIDPVAAREIEIVRGLLALERALAPALGGVPVSDRAALIAAAAANLPAP